MSVRSRCLRHPLPCGEPGFLAAATRSVALISPGQARCGAVNRPLSRRLSPLRSRSRPARDRRGPLHSCRSRRARESAREAQAARVARRQDLFSGARSGTKPFKAVRRSRPPSCRLRARDGAVEVRAAWRKSWLRVVPGGREQPTGAIGNTPPRGSQQRRRTATALRSASGRAALFPRSGCLQRRQVLRADRHERNRV